MSIQYPDWVKSPAGQASVRLCRYSMPPLLSIHTLDYPADIEFDYHSNHFSSACLIIDGAMEFKERGGTPFLCRGGTLAMLPEGSEYCWRISEPTSTLHCLHKAFSSFTHNELALLFGACKKRPSSVYIGKEWVAAFMENLLDLKKRNAPDISISIAVLELMARAVEQLDDSLKSGEADECEAVIKCIHTIDKNMDRMFSVNELARNVNISASRLFQLFHAQLGLSPIQYIAGRKAEAASQLLSSTLLSNSEIADRLGFSSANYFIRFFRKHKGISPSVFRTQEKARISGHI